MTRSSPRFGRWLVIALVVAAGGGTAAWYTTRGKAVFGNEPSHAHADEPTAARAVTVEVVSPRPGGIDRVCNQPGTVEPFESADLYAKVSGYLAVQDVERDGKKLERDGKLVRVDIGTHVEAGDLLARISVPEYEKQVKLDAADVARADAKKKQMAAAIVTAEADQKTAAAGVALAKADLQSKASNRAYREKQRDRIRNLAMLDALEKKLADEHEDLYQAAVSAELAAGEGVNTAKQKEEAAAARVKEATADQEYATAEVAVATARLEKSRELLRYTEIRSPYSGVVTRRTYHVGDFVRSAEAGGERVPVLSVERTDVVRVVVQVPDRDVPYVRVGNPAVVQIDALPGEAYKTAGSTRVEVSRFAASEDPHTRMMRTEIDLPNPDGKLRRGMYGRVAITLRAGNPSAVRIPSAALVGKAEGGKATVRVVRDDIAHVVPVGYGADNGVDVEILSGLTPSDRVILKASGPIENGTPVNISNRK